MKKIYIVFIALMLSFSSFGYAEDFNKNTELSLLELMNIVQENKGKVVFVNLFATWCPPCKIEIPQLIKLREKMSQDEIIFIGLSTDDNVKDLERFQQRTKFNYPIYMANYEIPIVFRADAIPYNIIYDKTGKIVYAQSGLMDEKRLEQMLNHIIKN